MIIFFHARFAIAFSLSATLLTFGAADAKTTIKSQAPCATSSGYCKTFNNTNVPTLLRSMTFTAPAAGTASITFHGTLMCIDNATQEGSHGVVDVVTQILDTDGKVSVGGPGSLRHAARLAPIPSSNFSRSTTFNLASTRVLDVAKGAHTLRMKMANLRVDPQMVCYVYNATFAVIFTDNK